MKARRLVRLLKRQIRYHGNLDVRFEIRTPTAMDPSFSAVVSEPLNIVCMETGNSPPIIMIMDWTKK